MSGVCEYNSAVHVHCLYAFIFFTCTVITTYVVELVEVVVTQQVEYVGICFAGRLHTLLHTATRPLLVLSMKTFTEDFCKF